ncbi:DUF2271 domain-containing protein [Parabacteroides sp. W1-Q-101]|uniref:DUF2271 domain-containing protein n=1 Tax=Parabacteroides TaxID=375288 RepID=UPI00202EB830|nr:MULTISPECIES: DUF2271 domain-containing protein [unclassified Parabacteroides]MCM0721552.1 DUF2271 domain-containing protein [Parabacteroides sp. W1-Q-101]
MTKMIIALLGLLSTISLTSCDKELIEYEQGDIKVCIEQGREWLHDFPVFLGIKKKNPPQIAIWLEDMQGNYLSTVYVSHKIATQDWQMAKGNRRKEALPHWCYSRGIIYDDGLYLPTKDKPVVDGISGATPRESFDVKLRTANHLQHFIVKVEVNHSTDFNDNFPKNAQEGDANYSGGKEGSGQPAVIYKAEVDLTTGKKTFETTLIGHSSPDGSDGEIHTDLSGLTTALEIVERITINIQ